MEREAAAYSLPERRQLKLNSTRWPMVIAFILMLSIPTSAGLVAAGSTPARSPEAPTVVPTLTPILSPTVTRPELAPYDINMTREAIQAFEPTNISEVFLQLREEGRLRGLPQVDLTHTR